MFPLVFAQMFSGSIMGYAIGIILVAGIVPSCSSF